MTEEECLQMYEFHNLVAVTTEAEGLRVHVCIRCDTEIFEEFVVE